jgi:hypothetical protein
MKPFLTCGVCFSMGLFAGSIAEAQELDGGAVEDLALQATWDAEDDSYGYWDWNEDGSVCLRLHEPTGECADRGTWATDDDFICYEFEWWGEGYGQRAACISVVAHEGEPYEVLYQGDALVSTMFHFTLLE